MLQIGERCPSNASSPLLVYVDTEFVRRVVAENVYDLDHDAILAWPSVLVGI